MENLKNIQNEIEKDETIGFSEKEVEATTVSDNDEIFNNIELEKNDKTTKRAYEIPELRSENCKVYKLPNGDEQAVFFADTIHEFDSESNSFIEIDKSFKLDENEKFYSCNRNGFVAKFNCDKKSNELFNMEKDECKVGFFIKNTNRNIPILHRDINNDDEVLSSITFENAISGADIEYSVTENGVKENIIIKEKTNNYCYPFSLSCDNCIAEYNENEHRVSFKNIKTGNEVFYIPAPFMQDANGEVSAKVSYAIENADNGEIILSVMADEEWLKDDNRAFPIIIDPQVVVSGNSGMTTYTWMNGMINTASPHIVGKSNYNGAGIYPYRMYLNFSMPTLPNNPRIKKAELKLFQSGGVSANNTFPRFGLYQVTEAINTGSCTPAYNSNLIDYERIKSGTSYVNDEVAYTFDITSMIDEISKGESSDCKLVLKLLDESINSNNYVVLYGTTNSTFSPRLAITYESSYGINSSYRTHTHEIGRFGQGSVDLACGNLMFESDDFIWAGNRMPVNIRHLYNSALASYSYTNNNTIKLNVADFSAMAIGKGFKLNIMQSVMPITFSHEGVSYNGYVYTDENGVELYFKQSTKHCCCDENSQCYYLFESVSDGDMLYDPMKRTLTSGDEIFSFDQTGKLISIEDKYNKMEITYSGNRIASVTDGVGRSFTFNYNANFLISIYAPDNSYISYVYDSLNRLTEIIYPNNKKAVITYDNSDKPSSVILKDSSNTNLYKVIYSFSGNRLTEVAEYGFKNGNQVQGTNSVYSYSVAAGKTTVTTTQPADTGESSDNVVTTTYTFDDAGNVISEYVYSTDTGNVGGNGEGSGINPHGGDGGSSVVSNINNLLLGHNFETLDNWASLAGNSGLTITNYSSESYAKFGKNTCWLRCYEDNAGENGIHQVSGTLPAGNYTFSVFAKIDGEFNNNTNDGVFIRVKTIGGIVLAESERIKKPDSEYIRLIAPFNISSAQAVDVQIVLNGKGSVDIDGAQLENNTFANTYNILENGNFENDLTGWHNDYGASISTGTRFNMSKSLAMSGEIKTERSARQEVTVKSLRGTRETFTLSGWAKGYGIVNRERAECQDAQFRLRAVIHYNDTTYNDTSTEEYTADFSSCTEEWQFASVQFSKEKYRTVEKIDVFCDYGYNIGTAYFDNIQLVRDSIETNLSASDFTIESFDESVEEEETKETTETKPEFSEFIDEYGNTVTETTFTDGEFGTIYRSFGFSNSGNDLTNETDSKGNSTTYDVDAVTSRNKTVTDRTGNKTSYEYDSSGRTTKVIAKKPDGTAIADVSYQYDAFDNMTEIARGDGMKYSLIYNEFHNLESIGVYGSSSNLVTYRYKNGNGRLKEIVYANGHTMKATYNSIGQMISEKWFESSSSTTPIAHYKYVYDGQGNIVRSIDILQCKEYTYTYENARIIRSTESNISVINGENISGKTLDHSIVYSYDSNGKLTKKHLINSDGTDQTIWYENPEDGSPVMKFSVGGRTVTSHSKTDNFGRKVFDELQIGKGFVSRQFSYHSGDVTAEHSANDKLKSSPTTQLVSQIVLSGDRTLSYEYDEEERITKVSDSLTGVTEYTYDALGQLLTETVNGQIVNRMTYDNYGNIQEKNNIHYTYGNAVWKDLLTGYGNQTITYDAQGNPINYLGHTLTWEKGRQLKTFDGNSYTYNANGIRTSKTVNGVTHTYILDGTKILRETWGNNTLVPLYDNEDSVCGIIFNDAPFYFQKNLQGDIISIIDENADTVAQYTYDAWGVCSVSQDTTNCQIATINPFRYRGYYYDEDIDLYYLQSRYYDAEVGKWISPEPNLYEGGFDIGAKLLAYNVYAYCANNSVIFHDPSGEAILTCILIGAGIGLILGAIGGWAYAKYFNIPNNQTWKYILGGALIGAAIGGCIGYAFGVASAGSGAVLWSGKGMEQAATAFAKQNGLKVLGNTIRGRLLNVLGKMLPWKVMKPLWKAESARFLLAYVGKQTFVHVFITADAYGNMESVFNSVEMQVVAELGLKIIWHFVK